MATTAVAPGTIKVAQLSSRGASFQIVNGQTPQARPVQVRSSLAVRDEENLLACARAGDAAAFASLVMPHGDRILRLAQRILRNREDAEDAVQTALLDAMHHLGSFQGRSRFASWLTRIALNSAFMRLRSGRRRSEMSLDEILQRDNAARFQVAERRPNPEQECSIKEARLLIAKAIDRLGPLYSEVLHMFHVQELSAKEAARILGVPVGTVKARLHRARSKSGGTPFRSRTAFGI